MTSFNPMDHTTEEDMMSGGQQVPPDIYLVTLEEFERKTGKDSGTDYLNCRLRIVEGEYEDCVVWDMISLSDAAIWKLAESCLSLGQREQFDIDSDDDIEKAMIDRVGKIRTKYEEWEGEKKTKVAKWMLLTEEEREQYPAPGKKSRGEPSGNKGGRGGKGEGSKGGSKRGRDRPF